LTLTLELLEMHMKGKIEFVEPEGGLYIYCRLPDDVDAKDYCKRALQSGAAVVHGSVFSPDHDAPNQNFRINFTTPTDEQLKIGIKILGDTPLKM
ncbi:MAG: PLP-dependent aminotransferase family protein, partial [Defluviitaleaceae bacterium]|nr:PLP-dependent aminotransferase family protein [Defluviitaleaceae bacterium]